MLKVAVIDKPAHTIPGGMGISILGQVSEGATRGLLTKAKSKTSLCEWTFSIESPH